VFHKQTNALCKFRFVDSISVNSKV